MKRNDTMIVKLEKIVGGGQTLGTLEDGRKVFTWGGLPGETVKVAITKLKPRYAEGIVTEVIEASPRRVFPRDNDSYLSTSPWQIMDFGLEQDTKDALLQEAFALHDIDLNTSTHLYSNGHEYEYRSKVEYSWWWNNETNQLDLAFYRRGTHGKIPVTSTSLAVPAITTASLKIRDLFRRLGVAGRDLKTLLLRSDRQGRVAGQVYVKLPHFPIIPISEVDQLELKSLEIIYSDPRSPASVITKRLQSFGQRILTDTIMGTAFSYPPESFFQINLPVYETALEDMKKWVIPDTPLIDLYSGVGTIGLTISQGPLTLVEVSGAAVREMQRTIESLQRQDAQALHSASEAALDIITPANIVVVDPPRAGLHSNLIARLNTTKPVRIIYLSCNPVTQARDIQSLQPIYTITHQQGYNFFPRTPHIENLVVLDRVGDDLLY